MTPDEILAQFIKDGVNTVSTVLSHINNLTISQGKITKDLKTARVVPLHKKNNKPEIGYRSVLVLNSF